ncbi:galectin-3b [Brachyhypopomus gauderio]|uniref:galectin-3b n=1 Tax=Brachyhypopomus gauderio TaxID=698409 RepID=UPI00404198BA
MDLSDALDSGTAQNNQQAGGPAWPGQPSNPSWPGQPTWPGQQPMPGQPTWPGQQPMPGQPTWPGQQPMPGQPTWPGQPNQPSAPGWGGPSPATSPQNIPSLTVPYELQLPGGIFNKMLITIQGTVKPQAQRFAVNLQGKDGIAFHFNPRFSENRKQVIVTNSMLRNKWGTEERSSPSFPFAQGQPFEMKILCTADSFKVAVNKAHLLEYKFRLHELNQINQLCIYEDVTLSNVTIETLP